MSDDVRHLLARLVRETSTLLDLFEPVERIADCYGASMYQAAARVLEAIAGIASELAEVSDPWFDFGIEPMTLEEAKRDLPTFLLQLNHLLALSAESRLPWMCIHVRAQTFFGVLLDAGA